MKTKVCARCKKSKPITLYTKNKAKKSGLDDYCPACRKERRRKWYVKNAKIVKKKVKLYKKKKQTDLKVYLMFLYSGMKYRAKRRGLKICDKKWFYDFAQSNEQIKNLFREWSESGYQKKFAPSVDRIDNTKGYEKNNIQFLSYLQNAVKGLCERFSRDEILSAFYEVSMPNQSRLTPKTPPVTIQMKKGNQLRN